MPAPQVVKDAIKPKTSVKPEMESAEDTQVEVQAAESEKKGFFRKRTSGTKKKWNVKGCPLE